MLRHIVQLPMLVYQGLGYIVQIFVLINLWCTACFDGSVVWLSFSIIYIFPSNG